MSKTQLVSIALTDYEFGRKLYRMCQPYESCTSQKMRDGWNDAECDEAWALFADEPRQAVRFSEASVSVSFSF